MFERFRKKVEQVPSLFQEEPDSQNQYLEEEPDKKPRRKYKTQLQNKRDLLTYLKATEGTQLKTSVISDALGYSGATPVNTMMREFKKNKIVSVVSGNMQDGFVYRVNRSRINSPRKPQISKPIKVHEKPVTEEPSKYGAAKRSIMIYLERNQGKFLSQAGIARAAGTTQGRVAQVVKEMCDAGKLERSGATVEGTRYRIPGNKDVPDSQNRPSVPQPEVRNSKAEVEQALLSCVEPLAWEFVRTTHSLNVLDFIEWLQKNKR